MLKKTIILLIGLIFSWQIAMSVDLKDFQPDYESIYVIRLLNGDLISGLIIEVNTSGNEPKILFETAIGQTEIFQREIADITKSEKFYKHSHRVFLLPTGEPISNNHFISSVELLFFYMGFGIADIVSVTAGRSLVPGLANRNQLSLLNVKATVFETDWVDMPGGMHVAVGTNLAFANHHNRFLHFYSSATFRLERSRFTGSFFYKAGSRDFYDIRIPRNELLDVRLDNGTFGIALGLDTRFPRTKNVHFIGEIWSINLTQPTHTGILMGIRLHNSKLAADFGLAMFTQPLIMPFASFSYSPF